MFLPASPLIRLGSRLGDDGAAPWQALLSRPTLLFARCRFALLEGLRALAQVRGLKRVWLPAWICCPVPEAVEAAGLRVRWYDLDEHLHPRLATIEPAPGDGLLAVHYFGLAQPLPRLRAFCDAHGMPLIEDCAHALPDPTATVRVGEVGDVAAFSLRKQLPVAGGGLLVVDDERLRAAVLVPEPAGFGDARELAKLALMLVERVAFAAGLNVLALKNRLPVADATGPCPQPGVAAEYLDPPGPSRLIVPLLRGLDWHALVRPRQRDYHALAERLSTVPGVTVAVREPPPGSVPLALPLWAADPDSLARALRRRGVEAICWPYAEQPPFDHEVYPGAAGWLTRSVCLPLATPLDSRTLSHLVSAVAESAASEPHPSADTNLAASR